MNFPRIINTQEGRDFWLRVDQAADYVREICKEKDRMDTGMSKIRNEISGHQVVEGLVVEVSSMELRVRFTDFAKKCKEMAETLRAYGTDVKSTGIGTPPAWFEVDVDEDRPKATHARIKRAVVKLDETANSAQFVADHLVMNATYRLDAQGAAELARTTLPSEDSLEDVFASRRFLPYR